MQNFETNINQVVSDLSNIRDKIAEKGVTIADGTPSSDFAGKINEVYEVGFEAGRAQGGAEFEDVSLTELNEQGRINLEMLYDDDEVYIDDTGISCTYSTATISIKGYVEISGTANGDVGNIIYVDGNVVFLYSNGDYTDEPFEYKGNVNESIKFQCDMGGFTFDRFVIRKDYDKGYADGKQAEYDRFWDAYQQNGERTQYNYAFNGHGWNEEIYKPKYVFPKITHCVHMFSYALNLTQISQILDFSVSTGLNSTFASSTNLKTIAKIIVSEDVEYNSNAFTGCSSLENITFEGTIAQSNLNFQWSTKLTEASLFSILKALSKDSAIASGKSITFATASEAVIEADTACKEQYDLATAAGWTIAFI